MPFCQLCVRVFDRGDTHAMKFDDFIQCCVMLRSLTDSFKKRDQNQSGTITISYEEVIHVYIIMDIFKFGLAFTFSCAVS